MNAKWEGQAWSVIAHVYDSHLHCGQNHQLCLEVALHIPLLALETPGDGYRGISRSGFPSIWDNLVWNWWMNSLWKTVLLLAQNLWGEVKFSETRTEKRLDTNSHKVVKQKVEWFHWNLPDALLQITNICMLVWLINLSQNGGAWVIQLPCVVGPFIHCENSYKDMEEWFQIMSEVMINRMVWRISSAMNERVP